MPKTIRSHVKRPVVLVACIFVGGTIGYHVIQDASWWRAFYMTVITLTTVGYGEVFPLSPAGQAFTAVLLLIGVSMFLYVLTDLGRTVLEGELQAYWGRVRRSRMIEKMSGHQIVCGYGLMGRAVVDELRRSGCDVVVVEQNRERLETLREHDIPTVAGDTTSEESLRAAGIERARGLVVCLKDDARNVYTVLTAHAMKPDLFIVARTTEEGAESRILRAGANRAVNPYQLGGLRLARLLVKPAVVGFFEASLGTSGRALQLEQAALVPASPLVGRTLEEVDLRRKCGLGVVAIQRGQAFYPNPQPDLRLQVGDVVIVLGTAQQIQTFEAMFVDQTPDAPGAG